MQISVQFGMTTQPKSYSTAPTFGEVIADQNLRAILGHSDNVRPLVHGVEQPLSGLVPEGAHIVLDTRANSKAARFFRKLIAFVIGK